MRFPRAVWAGIVVLLATFALQAGIAARRDSVTVDEFVHLPLGLYNLYTGDFSDDPINPPLSRMIAALPLLFDPPAFHAEADDAHWTMGYRFMAANADRYQDIYVRARTMVILVALVLGLVVFRWAYELAGWQAGLAALGLFAFTPELLAHGHLVTLDLCGALGFTTTCYATWRWLGRPTPMASVVTGAALGLATLLKLSGFVLVGAVASCVVAHLITGGSSARRGGLRS
jgi:dolichyl-phosphate-mannose--protein O-mannosyl transferase